MLSSLSLGELKGECRPHWAVQGKGRISLYRGWWQGKGEILQSMDLPNLFQGKGKKLSQQAHCAYACCKPMLIAELGVRQPEWFKYWTLKTRCYFLNAKDRTPSKRSGHQFLEVQVSQLKGEKKKEKENKWMRKILPSATAADSSKVAQVELPCF